MLDVDETCVFIQPIDELRSPVNQESHTMLRSGCIDCRCCGGIGTCWVHTYFIASFTLTVHREGLKVVFTDFDKAKLEAVAKLGLTNILAVPMNVSRLVYWQVQALADHMRSRLLGG